MITSIKTLILKDFIEISISKDLSILGEGTDVERTSAWMNIMSEYYEACEQTDFIVRLKLVREIELMNLHFKIIEVIGTIMQDHYYSEGAKMLRDLYPQYKFTKESILADLQGVSTREIANKVKYDRMVKQLSKIDSKSENSKVQTDTQKYVQFTKRIANINKHNGVRYDLTMTVLEFAVLEHQLIEHIEHMNEHGR